MYNKYILLIITIMLLFLIIPVFLPSYLLTIAILVLIAMGLASSLNLTVGFTGQISFAHAAFYGIGAYASSLLSLHFNANYLYSMLFATIFTGIIGIILGLPCLRLRGHYLAIATIGFQQIIYILMIQWYSLTNGPSGLKGIPRPSLFGIRFNDLAMYYLGFILVGLILLVVLGIMRSPLGLQMIAVREDEVAAQASGVNTTMIKLISFSVSSAMAGALGSYYAHFMGTIDPTVFSITLSVTILAMILGGGIGTITGPLIGAFVLQVLPEVLRTFSEYRMVVYGLVLILIILFMPDGIMGLIKKAIEHKKQISNRGEKVAS